jgi:hypothetical protein
MMMFRFIKIISILVSFLFLTGFFPLLSLLGPGLTAATSGNIYKAGAQYMINTTIKNKTGKNSLNFVKEKVEKKNAKKNFNQELMNLVEKRIKITRKRLNLENINQ